MENSRFYFHSNQARPYFYVGEIPVYLTTLLTAAHVLTMLVGVILGPGRWAAWAAFHTDLILSGDVWRMASYAFVSQISIGFILSMVFLYSCGRQLEEIFGRRTFGWLYGLGILVPAALLLAGSLMTGEGAGMSGPQIVHFCLLLGVSLFQPNAFMFVQWLKLKWIAAAFFIVYVLGYVQTRDWVELIAFVAASATTYIVLRRAGLSPRFEALEAAFKPRLPRPKPAMKALPGGKRAKAREVPYEPKLVPRPELDREHPAVVEIDAVLDKISKSGFGSLTEQERKALDKASEELKAKDKRR